MIDVEDACGSVGVAMRSVHFSGRLGDVGAVAVTSVCSNRLVGVVVSSVASR